MAAKEVLQFIIKWYFTESVSYTHLDVYKRQVIAPSAVALDGHTYR